LDVAGFECERCGTKKTKRIIYGLPSPEDWEAWKDRDDIVSGGCIIEMDSPKRVCYACGWPMNTDWTAFESPVGEFDYFHRPLDLALEEYDQTGDMSALALSFDGYAAFGGTEAVSQLVKGTEQRWKRTGKLPATLGRLRTCLFFEQQASHHSDSPLEGPYTEALVAAIRVAGAEVGEPPHVDCFVCGPDGLGIAFERQGPQGAAFARFTIDERWAIGGTIPQSLIGAILDECLTRTAGAHSHQRMRAESITAEFNLGAIPGREYCVSGRVTESLFNDPITVRADVYDSEFEDFSLASATGTMKPGPFPASVFRR